MLNKSTEMNLLNYSIEDLKSLMTELGEKPFRSEQLFGWIARGISDLEDMSNIPKSLRELLFKSGYYIGLPEVVRKQESEDGTIKCLFGFNNKDSGAEENGSVRSDTPQGKRFTEAECEMEGKNRVEEKIVNKSGAASEERVTEIESVFMKYDYGNSICISSQAGCRMGCTFCASTMDGLERSLTGGEMLAQVLAMKNLTGEDINHVVVMGMGEPFDNYDELARFIRLIHEPKGYNLSLRNITVSTCGIIPGIRRIAVDFPQVNLAVSLHAPNQEIRQQTMPIARKYGYDDLMAACRAYTEQTGRRITFEYALIYGVNDSRECAEELAGRLKGWLTHVNLIPLNEVKGREYRRAAGESVRRFRDTLERCGVTVTVRRTLGADIDAACGQLRNTVSCLPRTEILFNRI